jgi:glycosyltransferase involved in cell wall biosynthesis
MILAEPKIAQDAFPINDLTLGRCSDKSSTSAVMRAVVVHAGARDGYQVALALSERGMLEALVTDLFCAEDSFWFRRVVRVLPFGIRSVLSQRSVPGLSYKSVHVRAIAGLWSFFFGKWGRAPFAIRRSSQRKLDSALGRKAGELAADRKAGLLTYSYYGFDAISNYNREALLFQLHPHPSTMRRILQEELDSHPDCAESLRQEWELSLPEHDYQHLVRETQMASRFLVASSFTRASLIENGVSPSSITVIPYGVDLSRFHPSADRRERQIGRPLRLLFVGRINQRKGIKYLLEALRLLNTSHVHLTVCGRVLDDLALFRPFADKVVIRPSISGRDLVAAYQNADLLVFPSVAEGFGQVLLESLACGLPVLSTTNTAAPDLIANGKEGFFIEPRRPDLLAERIAWAMEHRVDLSEMRQSARTRAEEFTWTRFRAGIGAAVHDYLASLSCAVVSD